MTERDIIKLTMGRLLDSRVFDSRLRNRCGRILSTLVRCEE
jgi:hypothetical protein